jgi:hypothetical protein
LACAPLAPTQQRLPLLLVQLPAHSGVSRSKAAKLSASAVRVWLLTGIERGCRTGPLNTHTRQARWLAEAAPEVVIAGVVPDALARGKVEVVDLMRRRLAAGRFGRQSDAGTHRQRGTLTTYAGHAAHHGRLHGACLMRCVPAAQSRSLCLLTRASSLRAGAPSGRHARSTAAPAPQHARRRQTQQCGASARGGLGRRRIMLLSGTNPPPARCPGPCPAMRRSLGFLSASTQQDHHHQKVGRAAGGWAPGCCLPTTLPCSVGS